MTSENDTKEIQNLIDKMLKGQQRAIGRLMTLVENNVEMASLITKLIYPYTGNAYIIGVTGAPGSGKSSLINCAVEFYIKQGKKVGVIAVDPTSPFSGGAILGDRIRMKDKFLENNVFIRSMANRGQLGGLARATKDMVKILDAAGFDIILIETVGVGQSEVEIFKSAHTTVVIVVPGLGDEIQTIKAGIMEITDIFVVNKKDYPGADRKVAELEAMLELSDKMEIKEFLHTVMTDSFTNRSKWRPPIIQTNALMGENIEQFINAVENHKVYLTDHNELTQRLKLKYKSEVLDILKYKLTQNIEDLIYNNPKINSFIEKIVMKEKDPYTISEEILLKFIHLGEN